MEVTLVTYWAAFLAPCAATKAAITAAYPRTADPRTDMSRYLYRDFYTGWPTWRAFDEGSQMAMVFGDSAHSQRLPNITGLEALDALLRCDCRATK